MVKNIYAIILILPLLAACTSKKNNEANKPVTIFCIPDSLISQVTIDTVNFKPVIQEFNLIGKVTYDQDKVVKLYPMVSGNVIDVKVALGDFVNKGQILAI